MKSPVSYLVVLEREYGVDKGWGFYKSVGLLSLWCGKRPVFFVVVGSDQKLRHPVCLV